jgi:hypothetical protein
LTAEEVADQMRSLLVAARWERGEALDSAVAALEEMSGGGPQLSVLDRERRSLLAALDREFGPSSQR